MEKQLEFPMDIYPPPLRQIIEDTHRDLNFPVNYIAASLLEAGLNLVESQKELSSSM